MLLHPNHSRYLLTNVSAIKIMIRFEIFYSFDFRRPIVLRLAVPFLECPEEVIFILLLVAIITIITIITIIITIITIIIIITINLAMRFLGCCHCPSLASQMDFYWN